ncbi:MAG: hypothetical protein EOP84_05060 [Verrucomicrobiaceae bacterium]|nr:MAG: hypothetical protein EOP84_05060 [Verrucomicrobiaceae bacterium]
MSISSLLAGFSFSLYAVLLLPQDKTTTNEVAAFAFFVAGLLFLSASYTSWAGSVPVSWHRSNGVDIPKELEIKLRSALKSSAATFDVATLCFTVGCIASAWLRGPRFGWAASAVALGLAIHGCSVMTTLAERP